MQHFSPDEILKTTLYDQSGSKVGQVQQVYLNDETGAPSWVTVNTGLFGTHESLVPLENATVEGDSLRVPFDKQVIKDAPHFDPGHHLDESDEDQLYDYYGIAGPEAREGVTGADRDQGQDRDRGRDDDDRSLFDREQDRDDPQALDRDRLPGDQGREHHGTPGTGTAGTAGAVGAAGAAAMAAANRRPDSDRGDQHAQQDLAGQQRTQAGLGREDVGQHGANDPGRQGREEVGGQQGHEDDAELSESGGIDPDAERELLDRERDLLARERDLLDRERQQLQRGGRQRRRLRRHSPGQGGPSGP